MKLNDHLYFYHEHGMLDCNTYVIKGEFRQSNPDKKYGSCSTILHQNSRRLIEYESTGRHEEFLGLCLSVGKSEFWLVRPEKNEKRDLAYSAFVVKDIKEIVDGLKRKRVRFLPAERMGADSKVDGPISYSPYGAAAILKDSEGNLLMLWENAQT